MFALPLLVIALAAFAAYRVLHRQTPITTGVAGEPVSPAVHPSPFWPTTVEGKVGIVAFALSFAPIALVNVIQVAFVGWAVQITALAFTAAARFVKHDRSASVLIVFVMTAIGALASLLFLAGEVFIGHD